MHQGSRPLPEISSGLSEGDLVMYAVLSGNRNFEARIHAEVKANYLASPPLVVALCARGTHGHRPSDGAHRARIRRRGRVPGGHLAVARGGVRDTVAAAIGEEMFRATMRTSSRAAPWRGLPVPRASSSPGIGLLHLRAPAHVLRRDAARAGHRRRRRWSTLPGRDRRLGDYGPHLTCRLHQAGLAGRPLPRRARRRAEGLQLVRLAARPAG